MIMLVQVTGNRDTIIIFPRVCLFLVENPYQKNMTPNDLFDLKKEFFIDNNESINIIVLTCVSAISIGNGGKLFGFTIYLYKYLKMRIKE